MTKKKIRTRTDSWLLKSAEKLIRMNFGCQTIRSERMKTVYGIESEENKNKWIFSTKYFQIYIQDKNQKGFFIVFLMTANNDFEDLIF